MPVPCRRCLPVSLAASDVAADPSCYQCLVSEPLDRHSGDEAVQPSHHEKLDIALVQPECEFGNAPHQMLRAGVMITASNTALQDSEDALDAVGRHAIAHELASAVIDRLMIEEQPGEAAVRGELVSV